MAINESLLFKIGVDGSRIAKVVNESVKGLERLGREIQTVNKRVSSVDSKIDKVAKGTTKHLGRIGSELQTIGMYLRTYVAYRGISAFNQLNEVIKEYDKWLHQSITLLDDASNGYKNLDQIVSGVAISIGEDLPTAAKAAYQALSAGITQSNLDEFLRTTGEAALAGAGDMESTARVLSMLFNVYGDQVKSVRDLSDMLFVTIKKGVTTLPELAQHLGSVASIARQAGIRLDDLLTTLAGLTKAGIRTPIAVTAIRSALTQMLKPNKELKATLDDLKQAIGNFESLSLVERLKLISDAVGGSADAISKLFPNVRGLNAVMAALNDNSGIFNAIAIEMTRRVGATATAADEMRTSFDFLTRQLKTEFFTLLRDMAQTYLPAVIGSLRQMIDVLSEMSRNGDLQGMSNLIRDIVTDALKLATMLLKAFSFAPSLNKWLVYLFMFRKSVINLGGAMISLGKHICTATSALRTFDNAFIAVIGAEKVASLMAMGAAFAKIAASLVKLVPLLAAAAGIVYIGHVLAKAMEAAGDKIQDVGIASIGAADSLGELRSKLAELQKQRDAIKERRRSVGLTASDVEEYARINAEYMKTKKILDALIDRERRRTELIRKQQQEAKNLAIEMERQQRIRAERRTLLMWRRYHQEARDQAQKDYDYTKELQKKVLEDYAQVQEKIQQLQKRRSALNKRIENAMFEYRIKKAKEQLTAQEDAIKKELKKRKDAIEEARRAEEEAARKVEQLRSQFRWTDAREFRKELRERFKEEQKRQKLLDKMKERVAAKLKRGAKLRPEEMFIKQILDAEKALEQAAKRRKQVEKAHPVEKLQMKLKELEAKQAKLEDIIKKRADAQQQAMIKEMFAERKLLNEQLSDAAKNAADLATKANDIHSVLVGLSNQIKAYNEAIIDLTNQLGVLQ